MRLVRSGRYSSNLDMIVDFIKAENPGAALAMFDTIELQIAKLADHPNIGRVGRVEGTRELVITRTPYIVGYRIVGDTVEILTVLHGARQWPDGL